MQLKMLTVEPEEKKLTDFQYHSQHVQSIKIDRRKAIDIIDNN